MKTTNTWIIYETPLQRHRCLYCGCLMNKRCSDLMYKKRSAESNSFPFSEAYFSVTAKQLSYHCYVNKKQ